eukprot:GFKZ01002838.1.p1 GENE.GFKZ01002838.1~~GFKZ01002838.1.p1  ORF type:complete len:366 (+),score=31.49 GFKZ01002838.1:244-1341(+)
MPPRHPPCSLTLLSLPDEALLQIFDHLLNYVYVSHLPRISPRSLAAALPLASTCHRLFTLLCSTLKDLELWSPPTITDSGLLFLTKHAGTNIRRLILRDTSLSHSLPSLVHCTGLRTLDLSSLVQVTDSLIHGVCLSVGSTLQSLLIRRCTSLTDAAMYSIADHCVSISALDAASLNISDQSVGYLCERRGGQLRIVILSWCQGIGDGSLDALAETGIRALFLRGLGISDSGVEGLVKGLGHRLYSLDLLDCPNLTNRSFSVVRRYCVHMRDKLGNAENREIFQNCVRLLDGYIHVISGVTQFGQQSTLICIVDAGSANAFGFQVLSGQAISFDSDDIKVLATNSGLQITDETRAFVSESFGVMI